jgi:hypothetical protein
MVVGSSPTRPISAKALPSVREGLRACIPRRARHGCRSVRGVIQSSSSRKVPSWAPRDVFTTPLSSMWGTIRVNTPPK